MNICSNYNCDGWTPVKRFRCGKCRWAKKWICSYCDIVLNSPSKRHCNECRQDHLSIYWRSYHNVGDMRCVMCGELLNDNMIKTCLGECKRIYRNLTMQLYKKQLNKSIGKNLQ